VALGAIIAASDLTPRSREVAARACALAGRLNVRVILVHFVPPGTAPRLIEKAREALRTSLRDAQAEVRILTGAPETGIATLCREEAAVLVVLGLHRFRRVLDILGLTTMEKIVLRAPVPVLIAHTPASRPYRTVLSSTDFAPACAAALAAAAWIAAPDAEFHAIHALQLPLRDKFSPTDVEHSRAMTKAQTLRRAFLAMPGLPTALHLPEIVPGGVHEVLSFRVEELQPDLLAIGTHSGRDPGTLGNYARDLMREPPTDVLVAKPPA
jgi:nucleotide-binding universal stress UspA family protein